MRGRSCGVRGTDRGDQQPLVMRTDLLRSELRCVIMKPVWITQVSSGRSGIDASGGSDLDIPEGRTYAWEAKGDHVADWLPKTRRCGANVADMAGVCHTSTE